MSLVEVKVPDIGDFDEVAVIELLVKPGDAIRVLGKGNKQRTVPFGTPALGALQSWLRDGRSHLANGESGPALLLGPRGRRLDPRQARTHAETEAQMRAATAGQLRDFWNRFGGASFGEIALLHAVPRFDMKPDEREQNQTTDVLVISCRQAHRCEPGVGANSTPRRSESARAVKTF